jgi:hypothetical protein
MLRQKNWYLAIRSLAMIGCLVALLAVIGCATPLPKAIPAFRQGVVTASQQTSTAFSDINEMLREQQLDRAARQPALNEELFVEGIPADSRATWMRAFRLMGEYAAKLEQLLAPEQRAGVEAELRKFGEKISAKREEPLPEGVAGGFVKLGGLLVQIKAGQDALETMREVDPAIQKIFSAMADAIGSSNNEGVRLTIWSSWTTQLGKLQVDFSKAKNESGKRRVAEKYLNMLGERDAHDQLLGSLRISFLSLGGAHAAMARGDPLYASGFIAIVQDEYKGLREEIDRLREKRKER